MCDEETWHLCLLSLLPPVMLLPVMRKRKRHCQQKQPVRFSANTHPFPILCIYAFSAKSEKTTSAKCENFGTNLFFLSPSPFCGAILQNMHINRLMETWLATNVHFYSKRQQRRSGFIYYSAKVMYAYLGYQCHM